MLETAKKYLELIRFQHTVFALPFALAAALLAVHRSEGEGYSSQANLFAWLGILLCMVFARSLAMAFNRLVDRAWDAQNPRTASRHLPSGTLTVTGVTGFTVACALLFIASTLLFWPNWLPLALCGPVMLWLCGYSYAKRFTSLAHAWLGVALMLAPVCAWIALRGTAVLAHPADLAPALVLGLAVLTWVTGFDIIYACQDADFDRKAGLRSIPARYGVTGALRISAALHALTIVFLLALPGVYSGLGGVYLVGVAMAAGLLVYEHSMVNGNDLSRVNAAFFHVNAVISLGMLAVLAVDIYW